MATCCSYKEEDRGVFYYRNGTVVINATTGEPESCFGRDDALCCKVGNGNADGTDPAKDDFACFLSADEDPSVPEEVTNDNNCVCALISVNRNNDGDLYFLGDYCKEAREEEFNLIPACSAFDGQRKRCKEAEADGCVWDRRAKTCCENPGVSPVSCPVGEEI